MNIKMSETLCESFIRRFYEYVTVFLNNVSYTTTTNNAIGSVPHLNFKSVTQISLPYKKNMNFPTEHN